MKHAFVAVMILGAVTTGTTSHVARHPDAMTFPKHELTSDLGDVLSQYPDYLRFVVLVGRDVNPQLAKRLEQTYEALRLRDKVGAARFLRGLRFEMVQKLEILGAAESSMSTSSPVMKRWVAKYLPLWQREADEYLFRARTASIAKK